MDYIMKVYNSRYFTIGIFVIIAILALLFLILLLSGEKKKKKEKNKSNQEAAQANQINNNMNQDIMNAGNNVTNGPVTVANNITDGVMITPDMQSEQAMPNVATNVMPNVSVDTPVSPSVSDSSPVSSISNEQNTPITSDPVINENITNPVLNDNDETNIFASQGLNNMANETPVSPSTPVIPEIPEVKTEDPMQVPVNNDINTVNPSPVSSVSPQENNEVKLPSIDDLLNQATPSEPQPNKESNPQPDQFSSVFVSNNQKNSGNIDLPKLNDNNNN